MGESGAHKRSSYKPEGTGAEGSQVLCWFFTQSFNLFASVFYCEDVFYFKGEVT